MTMQYDISMVLENHYPGATPMARNAIRLLPLDLPGRQKRIRGGLRFLPPPDERWDGTDFFGNAFTQIAFRTALSALSVSLETRVRCLPQPAVTPSLSALVSQLPQLLHREQRVDADAPHHFVPASQRITLLEEMTAYAAALVDAKTTVLDLTLRLGERLYHEMEFDPDATHVDTPPALAFSKKRGVCQDYSHIMIACLRGLGIPAGYVSGFLRTIPPEGQPRLEGADAMHAWVRVWCGPAVGWVEFDPTNNLIVGTDHIVVAYGRDYSDVAPVKGVVRLAGAQSSSHRVDVRPME